VSRSPSTDSRPRRAVAVVAGTVALARDRQVTFLAAAVAYYAFVSVLPAAALALVIAARLGGPALRERALDASADLLTDGGRAIVEAALGDAAGQGAVTVVGAVLLAWGTLKVFRALDTAFGAVYGVDEPEGFVDSLRDAAVVAVAVGGGVGVMIAVGAALVALDLGRATAVAGSLALPGVLSLAFFPMYYRFPDVSVAPREAVPGAVAGGVGWAALQAGFQAYADVAGGSAFGALGGVLLLVTWLYLAAAMLLFGAALNAVLAGADGTDRPADPDRPPGGSAAAAAPSADRQFQGGRGRPAGRMSEDRDSAGAPDVADLAGEVEGLREELESFERDVEDRTVDRPELEAELKRYVRRRMRRGHARGWGPYLVLGYGVVLALGAFRFLDGWPAVAALFVTFTSTLGLYALFVLVGVGLNALGLGGKAVEFVRDR